jgi:hypothetical protein
VRVRLHLYDEAETAGDLAQSRQVSAEAGIAARERDRGDATPGQGMQQ